MPSCSALRPAAGHVISAEVLDTKYVLSGLARFILGSKIVIRVGEQFNSYESTNQIMYESYGVMVREVTVRVVTILQIPKIATCRTWLE